MLLPISQQMLLPLLIDCYCSCCCCCCLESELSEEPAVFAALELLLKQLLRLLQEYNTQEQVMAHIEMRQHQILELCQRVPGQTGGRFEGSCMQMNTSF